MVYKIKFETSDGCLIMHRDASSWLMTESKEVVEHIIKADAREKGVRIIKWEKHSKGVNALVEFL